MLDPPLWLTFFGPPAFVDRQGMATPLGLRYRKGVALLAWLSTRAGRAQHRRAVAALLWPDTDEPAARANLRVVLNDLTKRLAALGLNACLDI